MTKKSCPPGEDCDLTLAWMMGAEDARDKAKARIAALQQERDEALNQLDSARHTVDVLVKRLTDRMTKLAKAVEAFKKLDAGEGWAAQIARATLAEIAGDKT